jgi:predicted HAD superfamily Cof-like phosphohydrolase
MLRGPDDTPEIYPLPVFSDGSQCISYWQFSEEDWARIAANGGVYLSVLSGNTQPPVVIFTENPFVEAEEDMADSTRITVSVKDTEAFRDQERKLQAIRAITQDPAALNRAYILIAEFHKAYEHPIAPEPSLTLARKELRASLIAEELEEFKTAQEKGDLAGIADALMDLIYVVIGAAIEYGIPPECFEEVHRSNMSKLGADGKPIKRADGKSLKGPNYSPPDLASILAVYTPAKEEETK